MRVLIAATVMLLASCATPNEIRLTMRVQELEQIIAGKDDDLGYLMREIDRRDLYIMQLQNGAIAQARQMARLRDTCEI